MFCPWRPGTAVSPAPLGASVEILVAFGRRGRVMLLLYGLGATLVAVAAMTLSGTLPERGGAGRRLADVVDAGLGGCVLVMAADRVLRRLDTAICPARPDAGCVAVCGLTATYLLLRGLGRI
jgi:hypothetical protein